MAPDREIHIITSYFPPETGAASNRIYSLSRKLTENNYHVTVTTPLPNYPEGKIFKGYRGKFRRSSQEDGIKVNRLWIYASNSSNKVIRLFSMISFGITLCVFMLFNRTPKTVIIQCSPLLVGFSAVLMSKLQGKKIIVNVSDLWPLAGLEMGILSKGFYYDLLERLEGYIYRRADMIMGQSLEILDHVKGKIGEAKPLFLYRNFPVFDPPPLPEKENPDEIKIVYAGLIGVAQGIVKLCREVRLPENMTFDIYGGGPEAEELRLVIKDNPKISFKGSLERSELHRTLVKHDMTIIPLKNRIYGSVPSKIFEYSKLGLPILFFSEGEGADIVENEGLGIAVRNIDFEQLNSSLEKISNGQQLLPAKETTREKAFRKFDLDQQFTQFEAEILSGQ